MWLLVIQAPGNIFLQSDGIWGWGRDYPVQRVRGWQGGRRWVVGGKDETEVQLLCVWGSRKIVSGRGWHGETLWIAKPVISPRLWKSDKTLSVLLPFSFFFHLPPSPSISFSDSTHHPFLFSPWVSPSFTPNFPHIFLVFCLYIPSLIQVLLSQSRLLITANIRRADCLSEQQRKCNKAVPIPHPFPITRLERRWPTLRGGSVIKIDGAETAIGHTSRSRRPPVFLEASDNKQ